MPLSQTNFKIKQIWMFGHRAHFNLETDAGQAWVGLCVLLGQAVGLFNFISEWELVIEMVDDTSIALC